MPAAIDIMTPLWRGVVILRIITAGFAVAAIIVHHGGFDRPDLGWAALAGIVGWTVLTSLAYSYDQTRCGQVILIDLLVTLTLMGCSLAVLSPEQLTEVTQRGPLLPTVWACGPVVAAAVHAGRLAGALSGIAVAGMEFWLRGAITTDLACDALLLIGTGFVLGMAATAARRATEQLRRRARAEAATAGRERLARSIHDSVVQELAPVRRRGSQLDGEAGESAPLAGEPEVQLRGLYAVIAPRATGAPARAA